MLPIILISSNKKTTHKFIDNQKENNNDIIIWMSPFNKEFTINQIREIIKEITIGHPYKRIFCLEDFDTASIEAQNAFLKTLEESRNDIQFIMIVVNLYRLLPTILSRSKIVNLATNIKKEIDNEIRISLQKIIDSKQWLDVFNQQFISSSRDDSLKMIIQMLLFFKQRLNQDKNASNILREILKVHRLFINNNLNHQLSLDHLLIFIKKIYSAN